MQLDTILKQLKTIKPDADYAARVRASLTKLEPRPSTSLRVRKTLREVLRETIQSGSALALASLALIVILGGASFFDAGNHIVLGTPLDPAHITAEAQAIDIEVQLSGLEYSYQEAVSPAKPSETTISGRPRVNFKEMNPVLGDIANPAAASSTPSEPEPIGIDAALEFLGE